MCDCGHWTIDDGKSSATPHVTAARLTLICTPTSATLFFHCQSRPCITNNCLSHLLLPDAHRIVFFLAKHVEDRSVVQPPNIGTPHPYHSVFAQYSAASSFAHDELNDLVFRLQTSECMLRAGARTFQAGGDVNVSVSSRIRCNVACWLMLVKITQRSESLAAESIPRPPDSSM